MPQGSILGPLLFSLFVNDFPAFIESKTIMYADDTSLYSTSEGFDSALTLGQRALEQASLWFSANKLSMNAEKTQQIILTTNRRAPRQRPVTLLGIKVDQHLTWTGQVDWVCHRVSAGLFVLRRLRHLLPMHALRLAYFSLIECHLTYGILLWGGCCEARRAFIMQKKALRIIFGKGPREHCLPLFRAMGVLTLHSLYIYATCLHVHKLAPSLQTRSDVHAYNTRQKGDLNIAFSRVTSAEKNKINLKLYNHLPNSLRSLPLSSFKSQVKQLLIDLCVYDVKEFLALRL